ncbi:MAG TPA: C1 family peptidase [Ignavibacteria bacterium]|nr:C1 family peptidase [Ignavibacteria bacterium]
MKKNYILSLIIVFILSGFMRLSAQDELSLQTVTPYTPVKNQGMTGTCWCFASVSLLESEVKKSGDPDLSLSEMFIVRNIYLDKAQNYLLRQGYARFDEGAMGHDLIAAIDKYGIVPEDVFPGKISSQGYYDHSVMVKELKDYLADILKTNKIPENWRDGYIAILDKYIGKVPEKFTYNGEEYTPLEFAQKVVKFNAADYVALTSFTHHPFYKPFIIEVPDNFSNGSYYNVPLDEFISVAENAVTNGYSVMWDSDVSNDDFRQKTGYAMLWKWIPSMIETVDPDAEELGCDQSHRQKLFEDLTTQDDHLMHIVGIEKSKLGKTFFLVKNSWGEVGPYKGFINVSENYYALNTVSIILPKAALSAELKSKLGI